MMKATTLLSALLSIAPLARSQVTYNSTTGQFLCAKANAAYCAGDSLGTNIIVRCTNTTGYAGNCNDNLAGVSPVGVKKNALCYQSSAVSGDAACSLNGIVYGNSGSYPIPSGNSSTTVVLSTVTSTNTLTSTIPKNTTTIPKTTVSTSAPTSFVTTTAAPYPTSGNATSRYSTGTGGATSTRSPAVTTQTYSATPTQFTGAAAAQTFGFGSLGSLVAAGAVMAFF